MIKYMTKEEQKVFWEKHAEAHRQMEEDFNMLSPERKLEEWRKMMEAHDIMRNAKRANP